MRLRLPYKEVIKLKRGWAPAEFNLGMMYFLNKNYPDAPHAFQRFPSA